MKNEKTALLPTTTEDVKSKNNTVGSPKRPRYPAPFYDPMTKKLMKDPVVSPGGICYERTTWEDLCQLKAEPSAPAYTNRALRQLMEEALLESKDFRSANFRSGSQLLGLKVQKSVRKSLVHMAERSILPTDDHKALSEAFYCPITFSLMKNPVIGPEGYSFEKEAIDLWIDKNQVSPLTRTPLPSKKLLYPNLALQEMLRLEAAKVREEEEMNQSVRDYKYSQQSNNQHKTQSRVNYSGPNTLEEWEALRQRRRKSNVELTLNGLLQFLYFVLLLVFGVVVGIVLGTVALVLATVLDLLCAPCIQCLCPGGCHEDMDPLGDDEVPFIVHQALNEGEKEDEGR